MYVYIYIYIHIYKYMYIYIYIYLHRDVPFGIIVGPFTVVGRQAAVDECSSGQQLYLYLYMYLYLYLSLFIYLYIYLHRDVPLGIIVGPFTVVGRQAAVDECSSEQQLYLYLYMYLYLYLSLYIYIYLHRDVPLGIIVGPFAVVWRQAVVDECRSGQQLYLYLYLYLYLSIYI